jgi:hypothetical protein
MKKLLAIILIIFSVPVNATLVQRAGGQAFYDTVLNITWLANANLAQSENFGVVGIKEEGFMSLDTANEWVAGMNAADYLGLNTWRLPSINPINGSEYNLDWSENGSTDRARNLSAVGSAYAGSTASEMAHLYFNTLGNISSRDVYGNLTTCGEPAPSGEPAPTCLSNSGPFSGLTNQRYWSSTNPLGSGEVLYFNFNGYQNTVLPGDLVLGGAWAVTEGDALVPIPAAVWLFASGLGFLGWKSQRKHKLGSQV